MNVSSKQADPVSDFIERWNASGAAERANHQPFIIELCDILGVPRPEPAKADSSQNSYVFEHPVLFDDGFGHTSTKFIDLYRRGCFILEAKQGSEKETGEDETGLKVPKRARRGTAIRGTAGWDDAMLAAKGQAELEIPPFAIAAGFWNPINVKDSGTVSEKEYAGFADYSSMGKIDFTTPRLRQSELGCIDQFKAFFTFRQITECGTAQSSLRDHWGDSREQSHACGHRM